MMTTTEAPTEVPLMDQPDPIGGDDTDYTQWKVRDLLLEAKRRIGAIDKTARNTEQNYNFRGIDDVLNAASPVFTQLGILVYPLESDAHYRDVRSSRDKPMREVTVKVIYRFAGPVDHLDIPVPGESMDTGDKGTPKAMSVAFRIVLLQALMIPTKEIDPDAQSYERGDLQAEAARRDAERPSKEQLTQEVLLLAEQAREKRNESEYDSMERVAKYCAGRLGVNVVAKQEPEGPVEEVDLSRMSEAQLLRLRAVIQKSIRELTAEQQEV